MDRGLVLALRKYSADVRHTVRTHSRQIGCVPETYVHTHRRMWATDQ